MLWFAKDKSKALVCDLGEIRPWEIARDGYPQTAVRGDLACLLNLFVGNEEYQVLGKSQSFGLSCVARM